MQIVAYHHVKPVGRLQFREWYVLISSKALMKCLTQIYGMAAKGPGGWLVFQG